ncbi:serine protease [bacterium]|nr:serine protease [bacterium]RQV94408.1 MAG: serine protease [bacterium]
MSWKRLIFQLFLLMGVSRVAWTQSLFKSSLDSDMECNKIAKWLKRSKSSVVSIQLYTPEQKEGYCRIGSGFVYDPEGWVVTRSSIVQDSDSIIVTFPDGRSSPAHIVHCDEMTKIALLKVDLSNLNSVSIGRTSSLDRESELIVLGNSLGIFPSVTLGTYEGLRLDGMMQLRMVVVPGNGGSPVFDREGHIVGILAGRVLEEGNQDLELGNWGVALPIELVTEVVNDVLQHVKEGKGWIGLSVIDVENGQSEKVLKVVGLVPGGPAQKAEICIGDTIVGFEGESVPHAQELRKMVRNMTTSREVEFTIRKRGNELSRFVKIGGIP